MNKHLVICLLLAGLLAGCRAQRPEAAPEIGPLPANSFKRQWSTNLQLSGGDQVNRIYLRDNLLLLYTGKNVVYQLRRDNGMFNTQYKPVRSDMELYSPIVTEKYIAFPATLSVEVYQRDGRLFKTIPLDDNVSTSGDGEGTRLLIGVDRTGGGRVQALNLDSPYRGVEWQVMTLGRISSAPAIHNGLAYIASQDGRVYAISAETGRGVWPTPGTFNTGGPIVADIEAEDRGVYVASTDGRLYCIHPTSMQLLWQYFGGQALRHAPVVTATTVYQAVPGKGIVAINKGAVPADKAGVPEYAYNRRERWASNNITQILSEDQRYVYAVGRGNVIVALDRATGEERFRSRRTNFRQYATNTRDATIYAATPQGQVVGIVPVLRGGEVGELVLDIRPLEPVAMID